MAELKIKADSGGGTVSLKGPATTNSNAAVNVTLQKASIDLSSAGTDGQFLKTDGAGTLSFATVDTSIADDSITEAKLDIHAAPSGTDKFLGYTANGMEWATAGGGKVVAVKYAQTDTTYTIAKSDSSWTDLTNANITHTPAATGNYVIAIANIKHEPSGNTGSNGGVRLYNSTGSTAITSGGIFDITQGTHERQATMTMGYHTPNSTSSISFRVQCSCWSASANTWSVGGSGGIGIQHFIIEVEPTS